ncbi:Hypothetical predicted protein [Octopus vulgaris]|uniref:Uncharacterized protein n=1 Tax=Octopus vulgaris TaxID=6645 RepID=A0AA36AIQ1_OCTVU|nr:Hypothetical predicted protein [Octopus vulgaris]
MSDWNQLNTYYRIIYDYLKPDQVISCAEGVLQSIVGTANSDQGDTTLASSDTANAPGRLCFVNSPVQVRVLLGLLAYFFITIVLIHLAWLLYGFDINELFVRSGIQQPQAQRPRHKASYSEKISRSAQASNIPINKSNFMD